MKKILLVLSLVAVSCVGDNDYKIGLRDITGVKLFDDMATPFGAFGNPSDFYVGELAELEQEVVEESIDYIDSGGGLSVVFQISNSIHVYPNPVNNILNIDYPYKIDNVWVIKGKLTRAFQKIDVKIDDFSNDYNLEKLRTISEGLIENVNSSNVKINFSNKEPGFYKVFVETRERLVWYSVYKQGVVNSQEELFSEMNYWK